MNVSFCVTSLFQEITEAAFTLLLEKIAKPTAQFPQT